MFHDFIPDILRLILENTTFYNFFSSVVAFRPVSLGS